MKPGSLDRLNVLGVAVSALNLPESLDQFDGWFERGEHHYVCVCNVHGIMECQKSTALKRMFNLAGLVTPDGMPLVWLLRHAGYKEASRVYGPDLMIAELTRAPARSRTHYFYGGAAGVADELKTVMETRINGLRVVGTMSPPIGGVDELIAQTTADRINAANPDVVWVSLGCPKQEMWMSLMRPRLNATILIGVGAAFDFHTGRIRQAPRWMMDSGLEWLFRLLTEPKRLWRRYVLYNPWFVWSVALQLIGFARYEIEA